MTSKSFAIGLIALAAAAFSLCPEPANATFISSSCGSVISSLSRTQDTPSYTTSQNFVNVSGAVATLTIPGGSPSKCMKIRFYLSGRCDWDDNGQYCFVRAVDNAAVVPPITQVNATDGGRPLSHAFEWHRRIGLGNSHHSDPMARPWSGCCTHRQRLDP
jgi:hypothetical protein